jgi:hypothetical protein
MPNWITSESPTYRYLFCKLRVCTSETGLIDGEGEPEGNRSAQAHFHFVPYFGVDSAAKLSPLVVLELCPASFEQVIRRKAKKHSPQVIEHKWFSYI